MKTEADKLRNSIQYGLGVMDSGSGEFKELSNKIDELFELSYLEGQSSPRIKQLEWRVDLAGNIVANTEFGTYTINPRIKTLHFTRALYPNKMDEISAKQAAQADFEKRIKECLE